MHTSLSTKFVVLDESSGECVVEFENDDEIASSFFDGTFATAAPATGTNSYGACVAARYLINDLFLYSYKRR